MKRFVKCAGIGVFLLVLILGTILGFLSIDEYEPQDLEYLMVNGEEGETLSIGENLVIMTWNIGYGALGDNADFFMDGGRMVNTADEGRVEYNLNGMIKVINAQKPDILMLQEVDRYSTRSHYFDEFEYIRQFADIDAVSNERAFAYNYVVSYIPLPVPPIGKVNAGIGLFSKYDVSECTRVKLPCPFSWPLRTINLKRCLEVSRLPINNSDKELVLINLHLDAYDDGEGRIQQTKVLKDLLESELDKGNYVIAGGDFNQVFSNTDLSAYPLHEKTWQAGVIDINEFDDRFNFMTDASIPTCRSLDAPFVSVKNKDPENFQYYVIDGFIISDNIEVHDINTISTDFVYSDHNPLCVEITLK